jgi:hypothetical protein
MASPQDIFELCDALSQLSSDEESTTDSVTKTVTNASVLTNVSYVPFRCAFTPTNDLYVKTGQAPKYLKVDKVLYEEVVHTTPAAPPTSPCSRRNKSVLTPTPDCAHAFGRKRSLFYTPHTLDPRPCCFDKSCQQMTTTFMCTEHYPVLAEASNVHNAVRVLRQLYKITSLARSDGERSVSEVEKAMSLFFDYLWFNRGLVLEERTDVVTMRALFVEFIEDLATPTTSELFLTRPRTCARALQACRRFRRRHAWILHYPDFDSATPQPLAQD